MDSVDSQTRSRIMASVRGKNTRPEIAFRKELFSRGFRFRVCSVRLPGKPDLVLSKYRAAIFVHGCLWHWHGCNRSRMPSTNVEYWTSKISRNQERDAENIAALLKMGWRVLIVWECTLKARTLSAVVDLAAQWICSSTEKVGTIDLFHQDGSPQPFLVFGLCKEEKCKVASRAMLD